MQATDLQQAPALLQTARLRLLKPDAANAALLGAAFLESLNLSRPSLGWIAWAQEPRDAAWVARFVEREIGWIANHELLVYYAFEQTAGEGLGAYVGRIDLHSWDWDAPRCEVGYVGDVRTAGRGLMREAVQACIELALSLGAVRVQALSEIDNTRALHFAEHALGMVREGVLTHYERDAQGRLGQQVMFAKVREPVR